MIDEVNRLRLVFPDFALLKSSASLAAFSGEKNASNSCRHIRDSPIQFDRPTGSIPDSFPHSDVTRWATEN